MIVAKRATLHELRTVYDIEDLWDFHESIDLEIALQESPTEKTKRPKMGRR